MVGCDYLRLASEQHGVLTRRQAVASGLTRYRIAGLVRAGVLPLLTQPETIEGVGLWRWSVTTPGAGGSGGDCFDALAAALLEPPALPALQDSESQNAIRDLASELREHSDSVAIQVRGALDHAAREWKIQQSHSLKERERQLSE